MKYMGFKNRIAKEILPIILKNRKEGQFYVEPFVGGANTIDKVEGNRIGADTNYYLIKMYQACCDGWLPSSDYTEEQYKEVREKKDNYPPELVGYFGFALSYGGKWFGGWRRDSLGKRNYTLEAQKNAIKQFPKLQSVKFICCSYENLKIPTNSIVYCDPPYLHATGYKDAFNHESFYEWCRKLKKDGHIVYISEYYMPSDFSCVWQKEITSSLTKNTGNKRGVEKLFTL